MPHTGELLGGRYRLDDRIAAGGLNLAYTYSRSGLYRGPRRAGLGVEGAGFVDAVGPDVAGEDHLVVPLQERDGLGPGGCHSAASSCASSSSSTWRGCR